MLSIKKLHYLSHLLFCCTRLGFLMIVPSAELMSALQKQVDGKQTARITGCIMLNLAIVLLSGLFFVCQPWTNQSNSIHSCSKNHWYEQRKASFKRWLLSCLFVWLSLQYGNFIIRKLGRTAPDDIIMFGNVGTLYCGESEKGKATSVAYRAEPNVLTIVAR